MSQIKNILRSYGKKCLKEKEKKKETERNHLYSAICENLITFFFFFNGGEREQMISLQVILGSLINFKHTLLFQPTITLLDSVLQTSLHICIPIGAFVQMIFI